MADIKIRAPGCDDGTGEHGHRGHAGRDGSAGPTGPSGQAGSTGPTGPSGSTGPTGPAGSGTGALVDLSVNNAAADLGFDDVVLRTGGVVGSPNVPGAFNGGGLGNKAILGLRGFNGLPLSALSTLEYSFTSHLGPTGVFYNPPGVSSVVVPYINFLVDFNPLALGGDLRVIALLDSGASPTILAVIGSFANPGGLNTLVYSWNSSMAVQIVNSPTPNAAPGGVVPIVSAGASWPANAYSWAALMAANPNAIFVDAFPANPLLFPNGDGGLPAGAIMPAILLVSGDSTNLTKSGKRIVEWKINGVPV